MKPHKTKCFNIAWASLYYTISMTIPPTHGRPYLSDAVLEQYDHPEPVRALFDEGHQILMVVLLHVLAVYRQNHIA